MTVFRFATLAVALLASASALATDAVPASVAQNIETLRARFAPQSKIAWVRPTASPSLVAFKFEGDPMTLFATADGKMLLPAPGAAFDVGTGVDLTEDWKAADARAALKRVPASERIVFKASEEKHRLTVITDVDCGYCRKLHEEVAQFNAQGITIEYLLVARAGAGSQTEAKHRDVWCAEDRNAALTKAKASQPVVVALCDAPFAKFHEVAAAVGMRGTPHVMAEDGRAIGGYVSPADAIARLTQMKAKPGSEAKAP